MTNNEMALQLIELLGADPKQNWILKNAIKELLTGPDSSKKSEAVNAEAEPSEEKPAKKSAGRKSDFDTGKMNALLRAGWSVPKIADEMGVTSQTIKNHMKKEGYR